LLNKRPHRAFGPCKAGRIILHQRKEGFDSAKLAEALLTIPEKDTDIHSLLIIRDGAVVVDAYFHSYDGSTVHELASVTKSIMTTLIAIAADQGKLELDQPIDVRKVI
jgi:CubicO group peptidase (beta-lactamase class C family)